MTVHSDYGDLVVRIQSFVDIHRILRFGEMTIGRRSWAAALLERDWRWKGQEEREQLIVVMGPLPPSYIRHPGSTRTDGMAYRWDQEGDGVYSWWYVAGWRNPTIHAARSAADTDRHNAVEFWLYPLRETSRPPARDRSTMEIRWEDHKMPPSFPSHVPRETTTPQRGRA